MPQICSECDFFRIDEDLDLCPECDGKMRMTMLIPETYDGPIDEELIEEWIDERNARYEIFEHPLKLRYAQVMAGIGIYSLVSNVVFMFTLAFLFVGLEKFNAEKLAYVVIGTKLFFSVTGAVVGGGVAGAWCKNWLAQGIGVTIGVFIIPIAVHFLRPQRHELELMVLCGVILISGLLSLMGAFIGHRLVSPRRHILS